MTTTIKITKTDKVNAIKDHLESIGRRMTNLSSASIDKLDELITEYKIDIETYANTRKEQMKEQRKVDKQKKIEREEQEAEESAKFKARNDAVNVLVRRLDGDHILNRTIVLLQLVNTQDLIKNKEKYEKQDANSEKFVDKEVADLIANNPMNKSIVRTGRLSFTVGGIHVHHTILLRTELYTIEILTRFAKAKMHHMHTNMMNYGILEPLAETHTQFLFQANEWSMRNPSSVAELDMLIENWGATQRVMSNKTFALILNTLTEEQRATIITGIAKGDLY